MVRAKPPTPQPDAAIPVVNPCFFLKYIPTITMAGQYANDLPIPETINHM